MHKINKEYIELLKKYAFNEELTKLIDLVYLDSIRERENYYLQHSAYTEQRDLLQKLKIDLITVRNAGKEY